MYRVLATLSAALVVLISAQAAPAEAGKIGRAAARTVTNVAIGTTIKSRQKTSDKDDEEGQSVRVDLDARAAHAKAKLAEENGGGSVVAAAADTGGNNTSGIVCLAGCN